MGKLPAYLLARKLSKIVWKIVQRWDWFTKSTIGKQWVEATDSISANFSEAYGAYFYNDTIKFYYYCRRSLFEFCDWFGKANERKLITENEYKEIKEILDELPLEINKTIKRVRNNRDLYKK
ncbi:MAG: four helix bundle protein [Patescibacteria group bacterium]